MNAALQTLLDRYDPKTPTDWENALREVIQEIALLGLWRSKFFEYGAFYGGTALRIFYGLNRYSEDMDFSLISANPEFNLTPHLEAIRKELAGFDFTFEVEKKTKSFESAIDSAFIKGNTRMNLLEVGAPESFCAKFPNRQKLKVKLEVDTQPPPGASYVVETLLVPIPFQVKLFSLPCLFAGKLHAVLCRNWKTRVKGRDFFDFVWYLGKGASCDLAHLRERMIQTGHWEPDQPLTVEALRARLVKRFEEVDFDQAKDDVRPFVSDADALSLWSQGFFQSLVERVKGE